VNRSRSNTQSSQTLWAISPVHLSTSRCSQTPLELSKGFSDSARAFSGAPESTCSCGGAFKMLQDFTYRRLWFWSFWDLCSYLQETLRAAETATQLCRRLWKHLRLHQQNVKWFGSHNQTTQQLWTATLILPDAPRCSQIGWIQSNVLPGALRLLHRWSWILRKLWNRIQEYSKECIVVLIMLPNQTIRMCKCQSY